MTPHIAPTCWKKVLCPVDFSDPARVGLHTAVGLAREFDGELIIFHAFQLPAYSFPEGSTLFTPKMLRDLQMSVDRGLEEWKAHAEELGAPRVRAESALGFPAAEIADFAVKNKVDAIVMSTHGRTGLTHAVMGSVAEKVVRRASCPVVTVRPPRAKK